MSKRANSEGTLRQRPDGRWEMIVTIGYDGGRRIRKSVYGKTQQEALTRADEVKRRVAQSLPQPDERLTVGRFVISWLEESARPKVKPSTYQSYKSYVDNHIVPGLGHIRLAKLTPQDVQTFLNKKDRSGLSPRTVSYIRAILRRALNVAMRWDEVGRNVATLVDVPRPVRPERRFLTPAEAVHFVNGLKGERWEAYWVASLSLGLRSGEVRGLRWSDVDLEKSEIRIRQTIVRAGGQVIVQEPKSHTSRRTLVVPRMLAERLREHRRRQVEERLAAGPRWRESGLVFTTSVGTAIDASNALHDLHRILEKLGLPRMRAHDLRHSCASLLLAQGAHPRLIMEQLGHSQFGLTMNTYSHVMPALMKDAADKMDLVLGA